MDCGVCAPVQQLVEREMVNVHKKTEQLAMNQDNLRKVGREGGRGARQ